MKLSLLRTAAFVGVILAVCGLSSCLPNSIRPLSSGSCKQPLWQMQQVKDILEEFVAHINGDEDARKATEKIGNIKYDAKHYQCQDTMREFRKKVYGLIQLQVRLKTISGTMDEAIELQKQYSKEQKELAQQIRLVRKEIKEKSDDYLDAIEKNPSSAGKVIGEQVKKIEIEVAKELYTKAVPVPAIDDVISHAYSVESIEYVLTFLEQISDEKTDGITALLSVIRKNNDAGKPDVFLVDYFANRFVQDGIARVDLKDVRSSLQAGIDAKMAQLSKDIGANPPKSFLQYELTYPGFTDLYLEDLITPMTLDIEKLHRALDFSGTLNPTQKGRVFLKLYRNAHPGSKTDKSTLSFLPRFYFLLGKLQSSGRREGINEKVQNDLDFAAYEMKNKYLFAPATTINYGVPLAPKGHAYLVSSTKMHTSDASRYVHYRYPSDGFENGVTFDFNWDFDSDNSGKTFNVKTRTWGYFLTIRDNELVAATSKQDGSDWLILGKPTNFQDTGKYYVFLLYNLKCKCYVVPGDVKSKVPKPRIQYDVDINNIDNYFRGMLTWEIYD